MNVFKGKRRGLKVLRGSMIVMKRVRKNELYVLEGVVVFGAASKPSNPRLKCGIEG